MRMRVGRCLGRFEDFLELGSHGGESGVVDFYGDRVGTNDCRGAKSLSSRDRLCTVL
jgi:hypothetical protein